jgi:hypothetical protein
MCTVETPHPDSTIYQLSDMLDRLVSMGAMFGFERDSHANAN